MENELKYFASLKLVTIVEYKVQNAKRYPIMAWNWITSHFDPIIEVKTKREQSVHIGKNHSSPHWKSNQEWKEYIWCTLCRCGEGLWLCIHTTENSPRNLSQGITMANLAAYQHLAPSGNCLPPPLQPRSFMKTIKHFLAQLQCLEGILQNKKGNSGP